VNLVNVDMKLLFICTHNRCRSILFEAICNFHGNHRLEARSAGSAPVNEVHPLTLKYLEEAGVPTAGLHSKSWDNLGDYQPDILITVCDSAAGESCPLYLGSIPRLHWGLADPSTQEGDVEEIAQAFRDAISEVQARVKALLALPLENLGGQQLAEALSLSI
jgi:arsenate reductase